MSRRALLILAHGSPRPESNHDIFAAADAVRERGAFARVEVGFLDCNEPDIPTAIDSCVAAGADEIVAVPYFLHSGKHLTHDLPEILEAAASRHPGVAILMGDYLGHDPAMGRILRDRAREALG